MLCECMQHVSFCKSELSRCVQILLCLLLCLYSHKMNTASTLTNPIPWFQQKFLILQRRTCEYLYLGAQGRGNLKRSFVLEVLSAAICFHSPPVYQGGCFGGGSLSLLLILRVVVPMILRKETVGNLLLKKLLSEKPKQMSSCHLTLSVCKQ